MDSTGLAVPGTVCSMAVSDCYSIRFSRFLKKGQPFFGIGLVLKFNFDFVHYAECCLLSFNFVENFNLHRYFE